MANKRSFFERLTGTVKLEEDMLEQESDEEIHEAGSHAILDEETDAQLTVDVYQTPTEIIIKTMVAGVKPDNLDVSITRDSVTIKGKREEDRTNAGTDYYHRELYWGSFSRTIVLPEEIDVDQAEATEKYGLLVLKLPKVDKNRQAKLKVKGS